MPWTQQMSPTSFPGLGQGSAENKCMLHLDVETVIIRILYIHKTDYI